MDCSSDCLSGGQPGQGESAAGAPVQNLGITSDKADQLFAEAGTKVKEKDLELTIEGDDFSEDNPLVMSAVRAANLPFTLDAFQHASVSALTAGRNVILTAPCGAGKFTVISLATDILRVKENKPKGVTLVILPLTAIMREIQSKNPDVACITMQGNVIGEQGEVVSMSDTIEAILSGRYKMILGLTC